MIFINEIHHKYHDFTVVGAKYFTILIFIYRLRCMVY